MEGTKRFLFENPNYKLVKESEDMDLLLWAHKKGYIFLVSAPDKELVYTEHDLIVAKIWKEKVDG